VKLVLKLVMAGVFVVTLGGIIAANFQHDPDSFGFRWKLDREVPVEVRLAEVTHAHISHTIEAPGKVEADDEVKISAQVMGRIEKLPVKEGDRISKGQLVVQLDQVQYQADVRSCESRVQRLKASIQNTDVDLAKSHRDLERSQRLLSGRAASSTEVIDNQTTYDKDLARLAMARAELLDAEATLVKAKEDLIRTTIASPLDGIVSQLMAKQGEVVVIGTMNNAGTVIMSISDPDTMVVRARIDESNVALVREGQKALIHFPNSTHLTLTGQVKRISPKAVRGNAATPAAGQTNDNEVATFETIISLDSPPPQVRLGMTASVEVLVEERDNVLSIPAQAVLHRRARDLPRNLADQAEQETPQGPGVKDPSRRYHQVVFVAADGQARCRLVKTGISDESRVEVLGGLAPGEKVITGPYRVFDKLKEGKPVTETTAQEGPGG
jgi:HlyD family secretion protein